MLSFKELREKRMAVSADFKISASGRKIHKMKKIADTEDDLEDKEDDEKKDVKESTLDEEFSSGNAQHALSGKSEKQQHSDYMKKTHNVTTKYHGSDEVSYHGTKANVKKALVNHYDDESEAKSLHPQAFKESVDESVVPAHMQGKQKPYVSSDGKGNYEVLGNKGQTKAEFSRKEHGKDAHKKAQDHLKSKYNEYMKEETELEEAVDKQEQRFIQLARLGLVDKANVSKLRMAIDQLKADKALTVPQRTLLLGVMMDLVDLVTGDDAVFQRVKMDVQKEDTQLDEGENKQMKGEDPCWKNYKMVGMKDKGGKKVPNCVPEATEEDPPFDKPYTTTKPTTTDKSGAQHTPMSRARHLARLALAKSAKPKAK
jgi:hypothetical protein